MKKTGKTTARGLLLNAGLALFSLAALALALEIGARVKIFLVDQKLVRASRELSGATTAEIPRATRQLRHLIRWSDNPRIIYELIPDLAVVFQNCPLKTNARGFRGPDYPEAKNTNTVRIVGLGDSYMFGWRVGENQLYLSLLSDYLNRDYPNREFQIINTAVPGYNTVMEVETLKEKGLRYDPDLVIVHFTGNDLDLPNFIRKRNDYFTLGKSFFLDLLDTRIRRLRRRPEFVLHGAPQTRDRGGFRRFENDPDLVPEAYRDMVGEDAFRAAMKELRALSRKHNFRVVLFSVFRVPDPVREICSGLAIPIVEAEDAVRDFMRENRIEEYEHSRLVISRYDDHPSPVSHRIYADVIYDYLKTSGILGDTTLN